MVKRVMAIDGYLDVIKGLCSNEKESSSIVVCYYIEREIWNEESSVLRLDYLSLNTYGLSDYYICFSNQQVRPLLRHIDQNSIVNAGVIGDYLAKCIMESKENGYFVLGDNRMYSVDSRTLGLIEQQDVIGYVIAKL